MQLEQLTGGALASVGFNTAGWGSGGRSGAFAFSFFFFFSKRFLPLISSFDGGAGITGSYVQR